MRNNYLLLVIFLAFGCSFHAKARTFPSHFSIASTEPGAFFTGTTRNTSAGVGYTAESLLFAVANEDVDMTAHIANPGFESSFTGWTNNGMVTQTNTAFGAFKEGNTYVERWVSAAPLPDVSISQTLTGLPNGNYTLRVAAQNILQDPLSAKPGAFIFANDAQTEAGERNEYTVSFLVTDGTAVIGFKTAGSQANWAAVDNFRLTYTGFNTQEFKARLQTLKDQGSGLLNEKMQNSTRTGLLSAIDAAEQAINDPNIGTEIADTVSRMQNALTVANASIAVYRQLQAAIEEAKAAYGDGSGNQAAVLLGVIEEKEILVENLDAATEDLHNGVAELTEATFAFKVANASGPAPVVTTDTNFARGATMAFGRSTISVPVAELLEHGFCWSKNPEPSIFDNIATKYFTNNGIIYHIEHLEPATVYYMRAYAISNAHAVGYGDVIKVITLPKGTVTYQLNPSVTNSGEPYPRIAAAMESATSYFNELTSIQNLQLSVNYSAGTPTAEASYGGYMQFGADPAYQRTGTALHEMGHVIGVGQHSMWYGPNSPLRAQGSSGAWLGERANKVVQFLDNNPAGHMQGDAVHMWPFGINGAHEDNGSEFLYISNALIHQALGEDGLPPTGGFATPAYTFRHSDEKKYYIKTEDETGGSMFLVEDEAGQLINKSLSPAEALNAESAAWYFSFSPATGYYQIRNAASGNYFTYQSGGESSINLTAASTPNESHSFQLMGARYTTQIGEGATAFPVKGYWIVRPEARLNPPALAVDANGLARVEAFDFSDAATQQRWLLLSAEEVSFFEDLLNRVPTGVENPRIASGDAKITLSWDFMYGMKYDVLRSDSENGTYTNIATDIEGVRYEDTNRENGRTYYYKIVVHNQAGRSPESAVLTGTPKAGRQLYLSFNEAEGTLAEDVWGGYHATLAATASHEAAGKNGSGIKFDGTATSYASLPAGVVSSLNDFTISTWVKMDAISNWMRVFDFGSGTDKYMFLTVQAGETTGLSNVRYAIKNGGEEQVVNHAYDFQPGNWVHFAITQAGNTAKLYINGNMVASNTSLSIKPADLGVTTKNYIAKSQFPDPTLNGTVDEFRIYNYAFTESGVQNLVEANGNELRESQTITFNAFGPKEIGEEDFEPGAVASSGLAVSYNSSNEEVAIIVDGKVRLIGIGSTTITAVQEGNEEFLPAEAVSQTLEVKPPLSAGKGVEGISLRVYPNPVASVISIEGLATKACEYNLFNQLGVKVAGGKVQDGKIKVPAGILSGYYLLLVSDTGKVVIQSKILIQQ